MSQLLLFNSTVDRLEPPRPNIAIEPDDERDEKPKTPTYFLHISTDKMDHAHMDHSKMDHSAMDHGSMEGHGGMGGGMGDRCSMNVSSNLTHLSFLSLSHTGLCRGSLSLRALQASATHTHPSCASGPLPESHDRPLTRLSYL